MVDVRLIHGSALHIPLEDESVQTVVTSPPYWGLRQYAGEQREVWGGDPDCAHEWGAMGRSHHPGQVPDQKWANAEVDKGQTAGSGQFCRCGAWYGALGLEPTPELYVEHVVAIFREVRRVLRADGTLWLNIGDSYASTTSGTGVRGGSFASERAQWQGEARRVAIPHGLKPKDLAGIPWMVAFALRADGWYLRSDIIWHKPNPMPESVTDRPTKSHEYLFLLTKSERYYYDTDAIREPLVKGAAGSTFDSGKTATHQLGRASSNDREDNPAGRNKRTVWTIPTRPYPGAHFATYPEDLVEPCVLAGSRQGDTVLDPFNGSGTTGRVAVRFGRSYVGVDISAEYLDEQAVRRIYDVQMEAAL